MGEFLLLLDFLFSVKGKAGLCMGVIGVSAWVMHGILVLGVWCMVMGLDQRSAIYINNNNEFISLKHILLL